MVNILNIKQKGYAHNFVESSIILNVPIPNRHIYFVGIKLYPNMIVFVHRNQISIDNFMDDTYIFMQMHGSKSFS